MAMLRCIEFGGEQGSVEFWSVGIFVRSSVAPSDAEHMGLANCCRGFTRAESGVRKIIFNNEMDFSIS